MGKFHSHSSHSLSLRCKWMEIILRVKRRSWQIQCSTWLHFKRWCLQVRSICQLCNSRWLVAVSNSISKPPLWMAILQAQLTIRLKMCHHLRATLGEVHSPISEAKRINNKTRVEDRTTTEWTKWRSRLTLCTIKKTTFNLPHTLLINQHVTQIKQSDTKDTRKQSLFVKRTALQKQTNPKYYFPFLLDVSSLF